MNKRIIAFAAFSLVQFPVIVLDTGIYFLSYYLLNFMYARCGIFVKSGYYYCSTGAFPEKFSIPINKNL
jgi:hypothetical protein